MYKLPPEELKKRICEGAHISLEELDARIKAKINEMAGLLSEEGAATILASELGVKLFKTEGPFKIKEIYAGMRNVDVLGKVVRKYEKKAFTSGERSGQVATLLLGDETGIIRVVLWQDMANIFDRFSENDIIKIKSAYAKENNIGRIELQLNQNSGIIINPAGEQLPEVKQQAFTRKKISELQEQEQGIELLGTVIEVSDIRFMKMCSRCNKKMFLQDDGQHFCQEHGILAPKDSYLCSVIFDDGSGRIRVVLWKNQVERMLGKKEEEVKQFREQPELFEEVKLQLIGTQAKFVGRTTRNFYDQLEFTAQLVFTEAELKEELKAEVPEV